MAEPNVFGVYPAEEEEVLAESGRAHIGAAYACCADGQYRFALSFRYSHGGFASPLTMQAPGFATLAAAREAALVMALARLEGMSGNGDPASAAQQILALLAQLRARWHQPALF